MGYLEYRFQIAERIRALAKILTFTLAFILPQIALHPLEASAPHSPILVLSTASLSVTTTPTRRPWPAHELFVSIFSNSTARNESEIVRRDRMGLLDGINSTVRKNSPLNFLRAKALDISSTRIKSLQTDAHIAAENQIPLQVVEDRRIRSVKNESVRALGHVTSSAEWQRLTKIPTNRVRITRRPPQTGLGNQDNALLMPGSFSIGQSKQGVETSIQSPLFQAPFPTSSAQLFSPPSFPIVNLGLAGITIGNDANQRYGIPFKPTPNPDPFMKSTAQMGLATENVESGIGNMTHVNFKIWRYNDDSLKLEAETLVPVSVLNGYVFGDGDVLNTGDIPLPMMQAVKSASDGTNMIMKRHSRPGSENAYVWQELPVAQTMRPTRSPVTYKQTLKQAQNPITVNYIIRDTTPHPTNVFMQLATQALIPESHYGEVHTRPTPQISTPNTPVTTTFTTTTATTTSMPPLKDYGYEAWLKYQCSQNQKAGNSENATPPSPNTSSNPNVSDRDILANLASMVLVMSKINKDISKYPDSLKTKVPSKTKLPGIFSNKDKFSSLIPLYNHFLKKGQSLASFLDSEKILTNSPVSLLSGSDDDAQIFDFDNDDDQYTPTKSAIGAFPVTSSEPTRSALLKVAKKEIRRLIKKKRKRKKAKKYGTNEYHHHYNSWSVPQKVESHHDHDYHDHFGKDIMKILKKFFFSVIAFKAAVPLILLFLAIGPLIMMAMSTMALQTKKFEFLWLLVKSIFHLHHHKHKGWKGWHPRPPPHKGWNPHHYRSHHSKPFTYHHQYGQSGWAEPWNYGGFGHRTEIGDSSATGSELAGISPEPYFLDDTELDTEHNRKVMEILMEAKNATLQKLLESWEVNFPAYSNKNKTQRARKKRRRRS